MASKTFLIQSEGLGRGDEQLGKIMMANFLSFFWWRRKEFAFTRTQAKVSRLSSSYTQ